ncbi:EcoKI restriction-modification system protein HsdS [Streptococcus parauberis]|nr:restriction endonuclease subunit S [Streptococcus parauberis]PIA85089.1 EcoKI restriction-modification system protein HsdS [Streptococcus parauberis]PIO79696.1 EcoKI restriction-modification system protein HsdS [Streptococcus parauberis]POS66387.1 EcoKI restriction-modification system protein HsdS [Streptococcus parauberis]
MMSKKSPQLRFEGFADDWEERKLGDVVEKQIKGKAQFEKLAPGEVEYLDTSRLNGGQAILTNGLKDVTLDDILILWDGSKAGTVYHGFEGALGSTLKAYMTSANSKFVYQYLKRHQDNIYNNYRTPNIPHVQKDFLNVFTISVPVSDEQQKIGSFFKQLDKTIALHQRKLDLLKEQKKGYLQKMFPKNGAKVPELRFEGFADDWEQRKLSEGTSKIGDGLHGTPNYSDNGDVFFINGNNLVNGKIVITKETKLVTESNQSKDDKLLNTDTILMSINGTIGNLAWYNNERVMLGKSAAYLTVSNFDKKFIFSYLQTSTIKNYFLNNLTGTTIKNLGLKTIRDTTLFVPTLEEQQQIGEFFWTLEETIALHQRKLDLLKEQKKGFLQKMFV